MAFHDDLLEQAVGLARKERKHPRQASLRRAVSTSYYALFHLLISEACSNWNRVALRAALGRGFDHNVMKAASNRLENTTRYPFKNEDPKVVADLRRVAKSFAELQEKRHTADYDNTTTWSRTDALDQVESAKEAFAIWKRIRNQDVAQQYLVSLLVKKRD